MDRYVERLVEFWKDLLDFGKILVSLREIERIWDRYRQIRRIWKDALDNERI